MIAVNCQLVANEISCNSPTQQKLKHNTEKQFREYQVWFHFNIELDCPSEN